MLVMRYQDINFRQCLMSKGNSFSTSYASHHTKFNTGKSILLNSRYIILLDKQLQTDLDIIR